MAVANSFDHLTNRMKLEWFSQLHTEMVPHRNYRRTSIICTIGTVALASPANAERFPPLTAGYQVPRQTPLRRSICSVKVCPKSTHWSIALWLLGYSMLTASNSRSQRCSHELFPWLVRGLLPPPPSRISNWTDDELTILGSTTNLSLITPEPPSVPRLAVPWPLPLTP